MKFRIFTLYIWLLPLIVAFPDATGPKIVKIPVPVTCTTPAPKEPEYPAVDPGDGLFVRVQKLLAKATLRDGYEAQLKAWGEGCHT
jgi:hypothetical protein